MTVPELSVVLVGRNDGYGGDFTGRLQTCLKALAVGEELTGVTVEVVLVEWNPPDDRPGLMTLVPDEHPYSVRVVTVGPQFHAGLDNPSRLPLFEYLGKNVGIRRASAETILVLNPDVIVFPAVLSLARSAVIAEGGFIRIDRYDFDPPVARDLPGCDVFGAALGGVFQNNRRPGPDPVACPGDARVNAASPLIEWPTTEPLPFEQEVEPGIWMARGFHGFQQLHIGMPGDFLMASRSLWNRVRGYWERSDTFTHLDTYLMAQLMGCGAPQAYALNPYLILHEHHPHRTAGLQDGWAEVVKACSEFATGARPLPNGDDWGSADVDFAETVVWAGTAALA